MLTFSGIGIRGEFLKFLIKFLNWVILTEGKSVTALAFHLSSTVRTLAGSSTVRAAESDWVLTLREDDTANTQRKAMKSPRE